MKIPSLRTSEFSMPSHPQPPTAPIEVREVDPGSAAWREAVDGLDAAGLLHRGEWLEIWSGLYKEDATALLATRDGNAAAALPLVRKRGLSGGSSLVSMPYFDEAGAVGDDAACRALQDAATKLAIEAGDNFVEIRGGVAPTDEWSTSTHKVRVRLALPDAPDKLLPAFPKKVRSQVRRALREEPDVECGGLPHLAGFHEIYSDRMRDLGSPGHGTKLFRAILERFPEEASIVLLTLEGQPVASGLLLKDGDVVRVPWAATRKEVLATGTNMALYHAMMSRAIEMGATNFDFGRTDAGSSHLRFKLQWGGVEEPLHWHRHAARQAVPDWSPKESTVLRLGSRVWSKLPLAVTRRLGPILVKRFA
ncbi:MAG: GNAT family N-acetyltransferase [Planctomycetota bacterium]|jgi:FemAB-related protein (PEP-CTERM system-associated)